MAPLSTKTRDVIGGTDPNRLARRDSQQYEQWLPDAVDGVQRANLTGVDNGTLRLDHMKLGAVSGIDTGTRGTYYFDGFESHRQVYIGP